MHGLQNPKHHSKRNGNIEPIAISKSPSLPKDGKHGSTSRKGIKPVISRSQACNGPEIVVSKTPAKQNAGKQGLSKAVRQDNRSSQVSHVCYCSQPLTLLHDLITFFYLFCLFYLTQQPWSIYLGVFISNLLCNCVTFSCS